MGGEPVERDKTDTGETRLKRREWAPVPSKSPDKNVSRPRILQWRARQLHQQEEKCVCIIFRNYVILRSMRIRAKICSINNKCYEVQERGGPRSKTTSWLLCVESAVC